MSIREYVGARYVPIFGRKDEASIEWDNTKPYEPLTIVIYEGNSYTSRQYVPADIDIHNQLYWALTGNYNAQVEAYRQEVRAYDDRITENRDDIDTINDTTIPAIQDDIDTINNVTIPAIQSELDDFEDRMLNNGLMFVDSPVNNGTVTLVTCDNGAHILIDCGMNMSQGSLRTFLQSHLGAARLDAFIITHFHYDHAGGDDANLDTSHVGGMDAALEFCDAATDIFVQMEPNVAISASEISMYNLYHDYLVSKCTTLGLQAPVTPTNGTVFTYGETCSLRMINTNPAYQSAYTGKSDNGASNTVISLNNFSIISEVDYYGSRYINTGDAETPAQRLNSNDVKAGTLAQIPHHARNYMGYKAFWDKINTDVWHFTKAGVDDADINAALLASYLYRYTTQIRPLKVWTNRGVAFTATLSKGNIDYINGYDQNMRDLRNNGLPHNANSYLPPATICTDNPFSWWDDIHVADLVKVSSEFDFSCTTRLNGDVLYEGTCPAYAELIEVFHFSGQNDNMQVANNSVVYIELGSYPMRVTMSDNFKPFNTFEVGNGFDIDAFPNTNWRIIDNPIGLCRSVVGLSWSENTSKNNADLNRIMRNNWFLIRVNDATTDTSHNVPVFMTQVGSNDEYYWRGMIPISTASFIQVYIHGTMTNKTLGSCRWVDTAGNTNRACTVVAALSPFSL